MTDTKTPERIWAWDWPNYTHLGQWSGRDGKGSTVYVRGDLHDAATKQRDELAAEVERLTKENERLQEALRPFAEVAEHDIGADEADCDAFRPMFGVNRAPYLTVGHMRRARAALSGDEGGA